MKMLVLTDSPTLATGYGRVASALLPEFAKAGIVLTVVGRGFRGEEHSFPFEIVGHEPSDPLAAEPTQRLIREWKPDLVFTIGDIWMVDFLPQVAGRDGFRWLAYFSLDGGPVPLPWQDTIRDMDHPVVFSRFGRDLVVPVAGRPIAFVPHGVDSTVFAPLEGKTEIQARNGFDGKFVIGCVARNQARKNLPALLRAFARFAEGKEDAVLYLHTTLSDPAGWDIPVLLHRFGIKKITFFTGGVHDARCGVPDTLMARIYNLFDLMVLPTTGEGFGLPLLESQSCGVPVLVTDHSACPELAVDPMELLPVKTMVAMNRMGIDQAILDEDALVQRLEFFYRDWKDHGSRRLRELGRRGRQMAEGLPWSEAAWRLLQLIRRAVPDPVPALPAPAPPVFLRLGRNPVRDYPVTWYGIVHDPTGYSQVSRQTVLALDRIGIEVRLEPVNRGTPEADMTGETRQILARLGETPAGDDGILVVHLQPDAYREAAARFPHRKRIGFTVWETDRLPEEWVDACNRMDAVIVPSRFNQEIFAQCGVTVPVHVVRHGIDPAVFHPSVERFDFGEELPPCRFLSVFTWQYRKGMDILLEAFLQEFSVRDPVCLILKTSGFPSSHAAREQVRQFRSNLRLSHEPAPVFVTADNLTAAQMRALYNTATCLVLPSRGEGAGLPFLEAAAQRIPSIAPAWGGHTDFLNEGNAFLVNGKMVPVDERQADFTWFRSGMNWFETDQGDLARRMRQVCSDPQETARRGERAYADMSPAWTWDHTVWDLVKVLDGVWGGAR